MASSFHLFTIDIHYLICSNLGVSPHSDSDGGSSASSSAPVLLAAWTDEADAVCMLSLPRRETGHGPRGIALAVDNVLQRISVFSCHVMFVAVSWATCSALSTDACCLSEAKRSGVLKVYLRFRACVL